MTTTILWLLLVGGQPVAELPTLAACMEARDQYLVKTLGPPPIQQLAEAKAALQAVMARPEPPLPSKQSEPSTDNLQSLREVIAQLGLLTTEIASMKRAPSAGLDAMSGAQQGRLEGETLREQRDWQRYEAEVAKQERERTLALQRTKLAIEMFQEYEQSYKALAGLMDCQSQIKEQRESGPASGSDSRSSNSSSRIAPATTPKGAFSDILTAEDMQKNLDSWRQDLDRAVAKGKLTPEEADKSYQERKEFLTKLLNKNRRSD